MNVNEITSRLIESVKPNELADLIQSRVYSGTISQQAYVTKLRTYAAQSGSRSKFFAAYDAIPDDRFEIESDKEDIRAEIESYINDVFEQIEIRDNKIIEDAVNAALASLQANGTVRRSQDLNDAMMRVAKMITDIYGK